MNFENLNSRDENLTKQEEETSRDYPWETYTVTRQDGVQVHFLLNADKTLDWDIAHYCEAYLLVVNNPFEVYFDDGDGHEVTYHNGHVIGVYYTFDEARDAADMMETCARVPFEAITTAQFLDAEGKLDTPKQARELKGISALHYLNNGEPIQ